MIIHVVQPGESAYDIAMKYGVPVEKLIADNAILNPNNLVVGEALLVLIPQITHIVQEGDTLTGIANLYGITLRQLLRNNPYLSLRDYINPGETLVISYSSEKVGRVSTHGYAYPYINIDTLRMTLPYLTYITVYSYMFTDDGRIDNIDDENVIELAKEYQVVPIMMINPIDINQNNTSNVLGNLLNRLESQERFFNNVLTILRSKGYYGVNFNVPYILPQNRDEYVNFMIRFSNFLNSEGYYFVFNTLSFSTFEIMTGVIYAEFEYSRLVPYLDGVFLMSYEWGNYIGIPTGIISFDKIKHSIDYMAQIFPPETIYLGIPILGYLWSLPFVLGESRGIAITSNSAVELASNMGVVINYDDLSKTAFFQYIRDREYVVRFRDIRTINEYLNLVNDLSLHGVSIWNIMQFFPQLWLAVNALYDINNIYENEDNI